MAQTTQLQTKAVGFWNGRLKAKTLHGWAVWIRFGTERRLTNVAASFTSNNPATDEAVDFWNGRLKAKTLHGQTVWIRFGTGTRRRDQCGCFIYLQTLWSTQRVSHNSIVRSACPDLVKCCEQFETHIASIRMTKSYPQGNDVFSDFYH